MPGYGGEGQAVSGADKRLGDQTTDQKREEVWEPTTVENFFFTVFSMSILSLIVSFVLALSSTVNAFVIWLWGVGSLGMIFYSKYAHWKYNEERTQLLPAENKKPAEEV